MTVKIKIMIMQNSLAARQEALLQPCPCSLVCMNGGHMSRLTDTYGIRYKDDGASCDFSARC